jgi:hypothetical protein
MLPSPDNLHNPGSYASNFTYPDFTPDKPLARGDDLGAEQHLDPASETHHLVRMNPTEDPGPVEYIPPQAARAVEPTPDPDDSHRTKLWFPPLRPARRADQETSERRIAEYREDEETAILLGRPAWEVWNSPLENAEASFAAWFDRTLPPGRTLKEYVETTLEHVPHRIGLELGGVGSGLFSGFTPSFFEESYGVNLRDVRNASPNRGSIIENDAAHNHHVIEGDVTSTETMRTVDEKLHGRKVHVVFERLFGGIVSLPKDLFKLSEDAGGWYERTAENGLIFGQVPPGLIHLTERWKELSNRDSPALDIQIAEFFEPGLGTTQVVRIHKRPGSPDSLPLISARDLMKERRDGINDFFARRRQQ